jgi:glycosyltransferase involved in cell wall biosynthesis
MPVYNTPERLLRGAIESVRAQLYANWELCVADDASTAPHISEVLREFATLDSRIKVVRREVNGHIAAATNSALDLAIGEFVALMNHDDLLPEHALYEVATELEAHPEADIVYTDEDQMDADGRRSNPYFKTDWNPDLLLGHNLINHLCVYRRAVVEKVGRLRQGFEGCQDYDLALRVASITVADRIRHIPAILYHWRRNSGSKILSEASLERCAAAAREAIRDHLKWHSVVASVVAAPSVASWTRVVRRVPHPEPLVSLIVPTRDRSELLGRCAEGILNRTDYVMMELLVADNGSREAETQVLLDQLRTDSRVRIVECHGSFNYSAINNRTVLEARGDVVVLLNNDVDVITPCWLREMVSQALRPEIGAVGAKLLYPDGRVQHAGVVLGVGGVSGHFCHLASREDSGYFGQLGLVRNVSAVTGACLAVRRNLYLEIGGLDETNLPVAYNDVDFCLRIRERGLRNLWTPFAVLYHVESVSRGSDLTPDNLPRFENEIAYMKRRWGSELATDPFYNPNFSLESGHFELAFPPRREKPWQNPTASGCRPVRVRSCAPEGGDFLATKGGSSREDLAHSAADKTGSSENRVGE